MSNNKPEALRLADELDAEFPHYSPVTEAAAELRRLHEANQELLGALERIANGPWPDGIDSPEDQCRFDAQIASAAIAKAEGQQ